MIETTGLVSFVKVNAVSGNDFGLVGVLDASTNPPTLEIFFLWFTPAERSVPNGPEWLMRGLQVSLVRDALTNGKTVTIVHDDNSSFATSVMVNA